MEPSNNNSFETNFALELFVNLIETNDADAEAAGGGNICVSPFLLEALLALVYLGSDGKTGEELKSKLQLQRFPSNGKMANHYAGNLAIVTQESMDTQLEMFSRIFVHENYEVDAQFRKIAENYFLTLTERLKREDKSALKNCMEKALKRPTGFRLEEGVKNLLVSAATFKNKWFLPFSAYRSGLYDFYVSAQCTKAVPMMLDNEMMVKFVELRELDARVVELPYEHDDELAMLLILPNKRDGLQELELKLKDINFSSLTEQMQMESVQLLLPKFKIDFECHLKPVLQKVQKYRMKVCLCSNKFLSFNLYVKCCVNFWLFPQMGLNLMFSEESNFKNLLASSGTSSVLAFDEMLHKACLEVNESGSEPAKVEGLIATEYEKLATNFFIILNAASKPIVISNCIDTRQKFFRADHPFFFAIRNREATFFMGHVRTF